MSIKKIPITVLEIVSDDTLCLNAKGLAFILFFNPNFNRDQAFKDERSFITEIEKHVTDSEFNIEIAIEELIENGLIAFEKE